MIFFYFLLCFSFAETFAMVPTNLDIAVRNKQTLKTTSSAVKLRRSLLELCNIDKPFLVDNKFSDSLIDYSIGSNLKKPTPPKNDTHRDNTNTRYHNMSIDDKRNVLFKIQYQIKFLKHQIKKTVEYYNDADSLLSKCTKREISAIPLESLSEIKEKTFTCKMATYEIRNNPPFNPTTIYPSVSPSPTFSKATLSSTDNIEIAKELDDKISELHLREKNMREDLKNKITALDALLNRLKPFAEQSISNDDDEHK